MSTPAPPRDPVVPRSTRTTERTPVRTPPRRRRRRRGMRLFRTDRAVRRVQHGALPPAPPQRSARGAVALLAAAVGGMLLGVGWLAASPSLEVRDTAHVSRVATPLVRIDVERAAGLTTRSITVRVDGELVAADVALERWERGRTIALSMPPLADGEHRIEVRASGVGLLRRDVATSWTLLVDTTPPPLRLAAPAPTPDVAALAGGAHERVSTTRPTLLVVRSEPAAQLSASVRGVVTRAVADEDGVARIRLGLADGRHHVRLRARDTAGNVTTVGVPLLVDTTPPRLRGSIPAVVDSATLELELAVLDGAAATVTAEVDGVPIEVEERRDEVPLTIHVATAEPLLEGRHRLVITARDPFGNERRLERTVIVDSTEELGEAAGLRGGARGGDVRQLHEALVSRGVVEPSTLGGEWHERRYGAATRAAVQRAQQQLGLEPDGVAGEQTLAALTLEIRVERALYRLTLYRLGEPVKSWRIAVGSPQYPTPAGEFRILDKQRDPTWTPPDSDWARDAEPIPPGPDNPLGTRWMGIGDALGIHGTNSPASLGFSVSHGCIRMAIPDVEELFELVPVGTRVVIV